MFVFWALCSARTWWGERQARWQRCFSRSALQTDTYFFQKVSGDCVQNLPSLLSQHKRKKSTAWIVLFIMDKFILNTCAVIFILCHRSVFRSEHRHVSATSSVLGSILSSCYCLYGVYHVLLISVWVFFRFSGSYWTGYYSHIPMNGNVWCPATTWVCLCLVLS